MQLAELYRDAIEQKIRLQNLSVIIGHYKRLNSHIKALKDVGESSAIDVAQYIIKAQEAESSMLESSQKASEILQDMSYISGVEIVDLGELEGFGEGEYRRIALPYEDTPIAKAIKNEIAQKEALLKEARNAYYPSISLYAKYDFYGDDDNSLGESYRDIRQNGYMIGINIAFEVFDGFAKKARQKAMINEASA